MVRTPERMTGLRMRQLEADGRKMGTANHMRYLSEVINALRDPADARDANDEAEAPLRALLLLDRMWGTSYASRSEPMAALNEVGRWLEERLRRDPGVPVLTLLEDLVWLKRVGKYVESQSWDQRQGQKSASRPRFEKPEKGFGRLVDELVRRRRAALVEIVAKVPASTAPTAAAGSEAALTPLPQTLKVDFADFARAREARAVAAKRAKSGKPSKDDILTLRAVDHPTAKLYCSTAKTRGMAEVFERIARTSGAPDWHLYASDLNEDEKGVFVGTVGLRNPSD
jgi:hypothetical protein